MWNNTKNFQPQQQAHVSIVPMGERISGLVKFDNSDPSMAVGLMLTAHVHAQCACKRMNTVWVKTGFIEKRSLFRGGRCWACILCGVRTDQWLFSDGDW